MAEWPYSDIRNRQLQALAMRDREHYINVVNIGDKIMRQHGGPHDLAGRVFNHVVSEALRTLDDDPNEQELLFALLYVRHGRKFRHAANESGMSVRSEHVAFARKPVLLAIAAERAKLAAEAKVTKDDVLQGLLNAVAVAQNSKDLTESWREIGRLLGYYEETKISVQQTIKNETTVTHRLEGVDLKMLSDDMLMQHAGAEMLKNLAAPVHRVIEHNPGEVIDVVVERAADPVEVERNPVAPNAERSQ